MHLNPSFITNILDIYGSLGDAWLKALPTEISRLSTLWKFRFLRPMPNLSYNFVGVVQREGTGEEAILKMAPEGGNMGNEIRWLRGMATNVPVVYAADEKSNACLMEYLKPGHSLKSLLRLNQDDEATRIICRLIRGFSSQSCPPEDFRPLSTFTKTLSLLEGQIEGRLLSKAQGLFHDLTTDQDHDVALHGDLHHDNVLASGVHWKAIDPHGYRGDPASEGAAMVCNALECLPSLLPMKEIIDRRLDILMEELPFDAQRIKSWAFCRAVLSAAWSVEDHGKVDSFHLQAVAETEP